VEPYVYEDLPFGANICLLNTGPGNRGEDIICAMHAVPLNYTAAYTAVSFRWGEPVLDHAVHCEGKEIEVTKNLYSALQRLSLTKRNHLVWANSICINQTNIQERGLQIRSMGALHPKAADTFAYLRETSLPRISFGRSQ
jgi:hypothetical protein